MENELISRGGGDYSRLDSKMFSECTSYRDTIHAANGITLDMMK